MSSKGATDKKFDIQVLSLDLVLPWTLLRILSILDLVLGFVSAKETRQCGLGK